MSQGHPTRPAPIARHVLGRPTGYAGGDHERRWKAAVRDAFADVALPPEVRVQVEAEFVLTAEQRGRREPDLDNLIKSTVDALEAVLGVRSGTGARVEADDVRVDRIVASKRHARPGEASGAGVVVSELPEVPL